MITNLLAVITSCLVTNTTEKLPQHAVPDPVPMNADGSFNSIYLFHLVNDENPTNKTVITEVVEVTTLKFEWADEVRIVESKKIITHKEQEYVKDLKWKAKE